MSDVLSDILDAIETAVEAGARATGFASPMVDRDEYCLLQFPPDPDLDPITGQGVQLVTQLGEAHEGLPRESGIDKWTQRVFVHATVNAGPPAAAGEAATSGPGALMKAAEVLLKRIVQTLRVDVTLGGLAWNLVEFSIRRWAFGDGSATGFTVGFSVVYHTLWNDPDHSHNAEVLSVRSFTGASVSVEFNRPVDPAGWDPSAFEINNGMGYLGALRITQEDPTHVTFSTPSPAGWGNPGGSWRMQTGFAGVSLPAAGTVL